jgi:phospholipid/cholesterol/gamma-HCH transport system substrate-binding protein
MPRTRSLALSELKIGILFVAAVSVAATVILMLSGTGGYFWQRYSLKTRFDSVPGLERGAPVRVAGVAVGTVDSIRFAGTDVDVTYEVSKAMRSRITTHSRASLGSLSLLGQTTIEISPSRTGEPIPEWGYVRAVNTAGGLEGVASSANAGLDEATRLIRDLRAGKGTLGRLITDDALYRDVEQLVTSAGQLTEAMRRGRGTVGRLVSDPAVYQSLQASLDTLDAMLQRIDAGQGSLGRLLKDERLADSLSSASGSLASLTGKLDRGTGTAGKLVNDPALYDRLSATADRLDRLTEQLASGQGTAGQLLQDKQLYENMNGAASQLRQLVADVRKDPKKYLSVKFSVF